MEKITRNGINYYFDKGALQSVDPPEAHFGFTYWALMIPPFKPQSILMLGAGKRTIPKLIYKIYGHIPTIYIDKDGYGGAETFVDDAKLAQKRYDYIIIDIFDGDKVPKWIQGMNFVDGLKKITGQMLAINDINFDFYNSPYLEYFDLILQKKQKSNMVSFLIPKGTKEQYFAITYSNSQHGGT